MKKSFSVNIGYRLFNIDEDAYERLNKYLDSIKAGLDAEGADEVIRDIEIRIAELLSERINVSKEVIVLADVEFVISELGEAEQIGDFSDEQKSKQQTSRNERRLFRDPDDRILGGVCSGLAGFFDIDSLWVRIAFVVLFMFGGSGLLIYLILWLVVPVAETSAEKLQMKGRKVNVNNLSDRVREEFDQVRNSFRKKKGNPQTQAHTAKTGGSIVESDAFQSLMYILGAIGGFFLIAFSLAILAGFALSFFADISYMVHSHDLGVSASFCDAMFFITTSRFVGWMSIVAFLLFVCIPLISMLIFGLKLIFRFRFPMKWYNRIASSLWGISFVALAALTIYHVVYYSNSVNESKTIIIPKTNKTIQLSVDGKTPDVFNSIGSADTRWYFSENNGKMQLLLQTELEIEPEMYDSNIRIVAHLRNAGDLTTLAYSDWVPMVQDSSQIIIPEWLPSGQGSFHISEVEVYIPVGTQISLTPETRQLLNAQNELDNVLMTYSDFVMTSDGLRPALQAVEPVVK